MLANFFMSDVRDKFRSLSLREQLLVVLVVGAAIYYLVDVFVFASQKQREQVLQNNQAVLQAQIKTISEELVAVGRIRTDDYEQKEREYQLLKQQVAQLHAVVSGVTTEAPKMVKLVRDVLGAAPVRAKTVAVKTLPVSPVSGVQKPGAPAVGQTNAAPLAVYKHGLDIEFRGNYLDLLSYLNKLEDAHSNLFWSNAVLAVGTYPENTLRASVFMLSTQPNL